jgi:hypothetical protein
MLECYNAGMIEIDGNWWRLMEIKTGDSREFYSI